MAQFECNVSDLNNTRTENNSFKETPSRLPEMLSLARDEDINNPISAPITEKTIIEETIINKLSTDKNIKLVLLVTIVYFITSSEPFMQFLTNTLPYLTETAMSLNTLGKIVIGFLIGLVIITYQTFF